MKTTTRRSLSAAFALTLALGLSACGTGDSSTDGVTAESPNAGVEQTDDTTQDSADTSSGDVSDINAVALAAIATAQAETGGVAYEIDDEDDNREWEVEVRVGDRSVEVNVSFDGGTVLSTDDDDDLDSDDRAALDAATITLEQAIETALAEVNGTLDDVELDSDDGRHYWEVTIDDSDRGDDVEVKVDVTTGEIIEIDS